MKSYHCSMCKYMTNSKQNYSHHLMSKMHIMNSGTEDRLYTCNFCDKTFSHRSSLSRHMNNSCKKREREKETTNENQIVKDLEQKISQQELIINDLRQKISYLENHHLPSTPNHDNKNDVNTLKPIEIIYDLSLNEAVSQHLIEDICTL